MIIEPKIRGFICTTAHPVGCFKHVQQQIEYVQKQASFQGPQRVLVIGCSTGYGLASRIVSTFGAGASTIGVMFERPAQGKRSATAGWYNTAAFEKLAHAAGSYAKTLNGDAFSDEIKQQAIELIRQDLGQVDLVVYSLASPRRVNPRDQQTYQSVLKPIGNRYSNKTIDPMNSDEVREVTLEPATQEDIDNTVAVMGGEDWQWWIELLAQHHLLADNFKTVAYSYIGPELTFPIYKNGTIGRAKDHLLATADHLDKVLQKHNGHAYVSVNKALVTQASSAIPVVPLYLSILFKVMKAQGNHEGCIEQMQRLFKDQLYAPNGPELDDQRRIRVDDFEMLPEVQAQVSAIWQEINTGNIRELADLEQYREDFHHLFGFEFDAVDYSVDVDPDVAIPSVIEESV